MNRKHLFYTLSLTALLLLSTLGAAAQSGQLRGKILIAQADGKTVPAVGAQVDVYRTDVGGKWNTKADKKGEFVFAGLPYTGEYLIAASAPNARPDTLPGVKAGRDGEYRLTLQPGDGRRFTEEEARAYRATPTGPGRPTGTQPASESAEDRKKREELEAKNREIMAANEKIVKANETVARTFKAGEEARRAKRYDEAITLYNEGLAADPEQPALLTQRAFAYISRGVDNYNASVQTKEEALKLSKLDAAKKDFKEAADSAAQAVKLIKAQPAPTDPAALTSYNNNKLAALTARAEAMRLFVSKADQSQVDAGVAAYEEYLAAETDAARKSKAQMDAAKMLFESNAFDKAVTEYQKILTNDPDNIDALVYAGLSLINIGYSTNDKAKFQEGANFLQRFVDKAPENHQLKADAKAVLQNIKEQQNIKPEAPARRRRG